MIYEIMWARTLIELEKKVNEKLKEGWELYGYFTMDDGDCCQPMIKRNEKEILNG